MPSEVRRGKPVSGSSDKMLELLQEVSMLKELDNESRTGGKNSAAIQDSKQRRRRRQQIHDEIKELASDARKKLPGR
jgi:hypothetical protein